MKIQIGKDKKFARLPKSFVNHTTATFGFIQPFMMEEAIPNGKYNISENTSIQLAPLAVNSKVGISLNKRFAFVRTSDIWRPFSNFYSGKPYSNSKSTYYPTSVPKFDCIEAFFRLVGTYDNYSWVYFGNVNFDGYGHPDYQMSNAFNTYTSELVEQRLTETWNALPYIARCIINGYSSDVRAVLPDYEKFEFWNALPEYIYPGTTTQYPNVLSADGCDFFIMVDLEGTPIKSSHAIGIRLGEFGRKLRQIYLGLGVNIDAFLNPTNVHHRCADRSASTLNSVYRLDISTLPFLAYCKAVYDATGIRKYVDYENTALYKIISVLNEVSRNDNFNSSTYQLTSFKPFSAQGLFLTRDPRSTDNGYMSNPFFAHILLDLMRNSFYTLDVDLFSKIDKEVGLQNNSYAASINAVTGRTEDEGYLLNGTVRPYGNDYDTELSFNGVVGLNSGNDVLESTQISPIIINMANKLLHMVNRENILGASIVKWFASRGITLDDNKYNRTSIFGNSHTSVDINPVVATSQGEDYTLGEISGTAMRRGDNNSIGTFTANDFGFLFCFGCVTPRVGYYQGLPSIFMKDSKYDFFTSEWDSMGKVPVSDRILNVGYPNKVIGVLPRYFVDKALHYDIVNGDYTRPSERANMERYWTQRDMIPYWGNNPELVTSDDFRRIGKTRSLGNFEKIFVDDSPWTDKFYIDIAFNIIEEVPMLPIMQSFDTVDDDESSDIVNAS